MEQNLETIFLKNKIAKCEDIEELKGKIFPMLKTQQEQWSKKINAIIAESGYTKTKLAEICGVSRVSVDKWCKGAIPKNRETFLRIGLAANYNLEKTNQLLQRYGQYPGLYSKSLEDCIGMFVLNQDGHENRLEQYNFILNKIKENIIRDNNEEAENVSTAKFDAELSGIQSIDELEQFISNNVALYSMAYNKFYSYVWANICANYTDSVFELAEGQGWSSSLRQCVSAIRQKKWYPTRNKIISLGLHLSMDHEQIDEMLELAHMEPLCAKNIFESVILFILDDASLNDMMNENSDTFDPDDLCRYAREILEKLELPEIELFISELAEIDDAW